MPVKKTALETIKEIQALRSKGLSLVDIAKQTGVSASTVHQYGAGYLPAGKGHQSVNTCNHSYNGLSCQRSAGHRGIHMSDQTGRLINWE